MEACAFRDDHARYTTQDTVIIGVSPDTVQAQARFAEKFTLPFILLADPEHRVAEAYDVWREKEQYGRTYWGIERSTFIIDPSGRLARVFRRVRAQGHSGEVLAALGGERGPTRNSSASG